MGATTYDDVIYPSFPYLQTHPANLATIARLFGLQSPAVGTCRVLELGCASGGNLLPMAEDFPDAQFVGIDLSPRQIEIGLAAVKALGLTNLSLRAASILDIDADWGRFDYILCHGVYSWVPDAVQDKILAICRDNLSPNGIAYVSYNTYPGWHMRGMLREIMCFHAARYTQVEEQVREARLLLEFLTEASAGENTPQALLLRQETQILSQQTDSYLYHEHLEENNSPCYFFEFAQKIKANKLQYLGDAQLHSMFPGKYAPKILNTLNRLARDLIQMEQYLDFVRNRTFRSSLVCAAGTQLTRTIDVNLLQEMYVGASTVRVEGDEPAPDGKATVEAKFTTETGATISTTDPIAAAAMDALGRRWPETVHFDRLAEELIAAGTIEDTPEARHHLATVLMNLLTLVAITVSVEPTRCVRQVSNTPTAAPLARYLAAIEVWVSTARHGVYRLDDLARKVVPLLDGKRTVAAVVDELVRDFQAGGLPMKEKGIVVKNPARAKELLAGAVAECLKRLAAAAVLVG